MHNQLVNTDAGVHVRELCNGIHNGPADERQVGEAESFGRLPIAFHLRSHGIDVREVDLNDAERVGSSRQRVDHMGARELANLGQRHRLVATSRGNRRGGNRSRCGREWGHNGGSGRRNGCSRSGNWRWRRRSSCGPVSVNVVQNIFPCNATTGTGAGDGGGVETVFVHKFSNDR